MNTKDMTAEQIARAKAERNSLARWLRQVRKERMRELIKASKETDKRGIRTTF